MECRTVLTTVTLIFFRFFDLISDWTELCLIRLICGGISHIPLEKQPAISVGDAVNYIKTNVPPSNDPSDISSFLRDEVEMENIIHIMSGSPDRFIPDQRIRSGRVCATKLIEGSDGIWRICLLSQSEIRDNRLFPTQPLAEAPITDRKLESIRSNPTNYWTFALHAQHEVFTGYWFERKVKLRGKDGQYGNKRTPGEFSRPSGIRIMKQFGSYIRYQIRAFNGLSEEAKAKFAKAKETVEYMEGNGMSKEEVYDLKLHIYIIDMIQAQINNSYTNGVDFIQIGKLPSSHQIS